MSYEIRKVEAFETLPLRQKILKPFATLPQCQYSEDSMDTTFHFALFQEGQIRGVSTFIQEGHAEFPATLPYRLRGMAIEKELQGRGLGKKLLVNGVDFLIARHCDLLWFNAREVAFPFYQSLGFALHGPMFELPGIGPHKVMYKRFNNR